MKFFVIACLVAVAVAEPTADAEADPALLYRNAYAYGNTYSPYAAGYAGYAGAYAGAYAAPAYAGYSAYAAPAYRGYANAAYSPYNYGAYSNAFGYRALGKRDADAEPTAEADPALLYGSNYAYGAYSPYAAAAAYRPYAAAAYAAPAYAGYSAYAAPAYAGTYGAYAGAYANAGRYYANSGGAVHIAKRDAEAEPTAEADPALLYGSNYAYGAYRSPYAYAGYNAYRPAYASAYRTPYAYAGYSGYNAYNGVYGYGK